MTSASAPRQRLLPHVRLYESIRTAHLERAHELSPASIVYRVRRYDFQDALTEGLHLVRASPLAAGRLLVSSKVDVLEINEPLMLSSLSATSVALLALAVRRLLGRGRTLVVTYAIGNVDPFARATGSRFRTRVRRRLERVAARIVLRRVDRIAFGTSAARQTYSRVLGAVRQDHAELVIPALPAAFPSARASRRRSSRVVFIGALSERKGVGVLLAAWPLVVRENADAHLTIVGKGPLEGLVRGSLSDSIALEVDPPREAIHRRLDEASVLVLPSQPSPTWREQVGLPLVEALSHGCRVVTTGETGLASWLAEHGHEVVDDAGSAPELADAILRSLAGGPSRAEVLASLPVRDGRLAADDWLTGRGPGR